MTAWTGGALLAQTLADAGTRVAFGLHGGHLDPWLMECDAQGIELVDFRHEAPAVNAADGYARRTGRTGVCFATAGSGFLNALGGLASSHADRSSVLLITSSPPLRDCGANVLQGGLDQMALARPVSKWACRVTVTEEIPRLAAQALRIASSGPKGPVVLDVPVDVLAREVPAERVSPAGQATAPYPPAPSAQALTEVVRMLNGAARPVMIVGDEASEPGLAHALLQLAEAATMPVFHQRSRSSSMPLGHPLNGNDASRLQLCLENGQDGPDVALLLGVRFGMYLGGRGIDCLPPECEIIHVSSDPGEVGLLRRPAVGMLAEIRSTVQALTMSAEPLASGGLDRSRWAEATTSEAPPTLVVAEPAARGDRNARLHPMVALREVFRCIPPGASIVIDGGEAGQWAHSSLPYRHSFGTLAASGYLGYLGASTGMAIGTAVADPDDLVVLVQGDGAAGFHLQELETMVRRRCRILVVVVNNAMWGMSLHGQEILYGPGRHVISDLPDTSYETIAAAVGMEGSRVSMLADIEPAVASALRTAGPYCLNIDVSGDLTHPGTEAMLKRDDSPNVLNVPYYDNIRLG